MNILISAIICTHNRAEYLVKALQSLLDQNLHKDTYEIIIVDNCSTDSTEEVIKKTLNKNIRYLYESKLGLSYARNTGWQNARGKYVAYLDDDAIACPTWLSKILEVFETVKPRPGCVGGKVNPIWEAPRPSWISDELLTSLTIINWSDIPHNLTDLNRKWLVGANIAFPTAVLKHVGGFTHDLDRKGKHLLSGGDVFLEKQIQKAGYTCFYHPEIAIHHLTPTSRLNQRWFTCRYYWQGISDAIMQLIEETPSIAERINCAAIKLYSLLQSPRTIINLILPRKDPKRFTEKCFALITVGHIAGLLGAGRR
ncbi:MAG: glycosyltransferase family 2 protein [Candidatus Brocadia sp. AMX2]|uniref:Glycosyltransferase family 2 n=1 Tax=Candidatus Brocadia sinica JPN1 TaxID=1197129 RepID=A0ABQ0JWH9_9BACT|nr:MULTISPECIES: glycosyltransferase family 2 protein [Brocadia]KXK29600.1 MAG: putative glycosyltransferase [Candidatus Brocadia sinica]MBC6931156.1 glycosyltransferase family 2 protein [Candidatus Brocadia sp.]MBL1167445.1 glycosyltransferase family 2 protein [Candidatus Brocadia sp. AMX1]NOG41082.1 glycosyltransferase [Planctomycetota bacterium]MCE7865831.1 glycosyltransferase family 2 protein [Candidatus Brocadia sp. AMX2]